MTFVEFKNRLTLYERLMRLDKPIGILLLLWPTLWALMLASHGRPDPMMLWIFILGTVLMRSAGCVMNDMADVRFDAHVERTRHRPMATGEVSRREALVLAFVLCLMAFGLVLFLNRITMIYSFAALALAATYPFTKRFFAIPQAYLGVAFGFGIPMAFVAVREVVPDYGWWMLLANVFWAIAYDTEYAMVDRDDDIRLGMRTSAITFGRFDVAAVMICYALMLAVLAYIGKLMLFGNVYYGGLVVAALIMVYHYRLIARRDRDGCFKAFRHNNWVGAAVFAGIAGEYLSRARDLAWIWN
jgi:4-hydroxybenzoate polyprenyltransferase